MGPKPVIPFNFQDNLKYFTKFKIKSTMKPIKYLFLLAFVATSGWVTAQKPIILTEDSLSFGTSKYPGFTVSVPEVNYDRAEKNWIKELQSGTKSKVIVENGEMSIFGAIIKDISPNPMNVYSKLVNQDSMLYLMVTIELKKDQYIEKANGDAELTAAKTYLKQFAKDQYLDLVKGELHEEEKKLKDLNSDLNSLQNEKTRMQKSIQSNRTNITSEKDNIVLQNNELAKLTVEIETQNNQLTSMEEGAAKEEKSSYIKDLEKSKKKLLNSIESSENKISRANSEIDEADRNIPKNESQQETMRGKIAQQEAVVQRFTNKHNTVKAY
jgi:peptidoglycan hydrolase CwlO-like protein